MTDGGLSTNGGVNLWQGTQVDGSYYWSWDPHINPLVPYVRDDVLENHVGMRIALAHIVHHPLSTALHGLLKWFFLYWRDDNVISVTFGQMHPPWSGIELALAAWFNNVVYYGWMIVAVYGLVRTWRDSAAERWRVVFLLVFLGYYMAVFFFFPAWDRFRFPEMPLFSVFFGAGAARLMQRAKQSAYPRRARGVLLEIEATSSG